MQAIWNSLRLLPTAVTAIPRWIPGQTFQANFSSLARRSPMSAESLLAARTSYPEPLRPSSISSYPLLTQIRTITRNYWPRPDEAKRIRRHGWVKRMSTEAGRRIIMRRILKGRYILTH